MNNIEENSTQSKAIAAMPAWVMKAMPNEQLWNPRFPAYPLYRMAGIMLDISKLVRLGVCGLEEEVRRRMGRVNTEGGDGSVFEGMLAALRILRKCLVFYAEQADRQGVELLAVAPENPGNAGGDVESRIVDLKRLALACRRLLEAPPATFHEGLQLVWLYAVAAVARVAYDCFVKQCARHEIKAKLGRSFSRDQQEYRAKARGLDRKPRGRPRSPIEPFVFENAEAETLISSDGVGYAFSHKQHWVPVLPGGSGHDTFVDGL